MFKIGEFSIIAQVSSRLLRYYDEISLFSPEFTDPQSGYRFYSAQQLPRLNRILAARELGFTLEQIQRLLDQNLSTAELSGMLTLRKAQIEQTVQAEAERLRVVASRLRQIEEEGRDLASDLLLKLVSAQPFLSLREMLPGPAAVRGLVETLHTHVPSAVGAGQLGPLTLVVHAPMYEPEAMDFELGYPVSGEVPHTLALSDTRTLTLSELPALATVASTVHVGPTAEVHRAYGQLATWLERQGWQVEGPGRQVMLQLPLGGPAAQAVIEVQLPVTRVGPPGA